MERVKFASVEKHFASDPDLADDVSDHYPIVLHMDVGVEAEGQGAGGLSLPKAMTIFYGWPSSVNGAGGIVEVVFRIKASFVSDDL